MRRRLFVPLLLAGVLAVSADTSAAVPHDAYLQQVEQWRDGRLARLTAADGWLSLVGLAWLHEGANRVGSAADNDVVLPTGPAHLGTVTLSGEGRLHLVLAQGSGATVDGKAVPEADLVDDMHAGEGAPTLVSVW